MLRAAPHDIVQAVHGATTSNGADRKRCVGELLLCICTQVGRDGEGTGDGRCGNTCVHRCVGAQRGLLIELGGVALLDELTFPSECVDQALIGEVELGGVHGLIAVGEAVGSGEFAPTVLADCAVCPLGVVAVTLDVVLIEGRVKSVVAIGVNSGLCNEFLEGTAIGGVPGQLGHVFLGVASFLCDLGVVEQTHGVPVLGQAVTLALELRQISKSGLVDGIIDSSFLCLVSEIQNLLGINELEQTRGVIDEGVGGVRCCQLSGQRIPVLTPCGLGDLDGDIRIFCVEVVSALLVQRGLTVIPQPVADGHTVTRCRGGTRGARGVGVARAQGQRHCCDNPR